MKVRSSRRESAQNWPLDFANVIELTVDQSLAQVCRRLAVARWRRRIRRQIQFAHRNARQVADIQASPVDVRVGRCRVTGSDVQWCREGVVADVWSVMTRAAGSHKGRN